MSDPPQLRLNDECLDSRHVGSVQHFSVRYPVFPRDTHDLAQASEVKLVERDQLVCSGETKYIINYIYDIIVKQIVYTDVVHHVSCSKAMQLVENSLYYC